MDNHAIHIRELTVADIGFADSLRSIAGWNQTVPDWERFIACEPRGCFLAEWNGKSAGTATTICYGVDLAWIGMVLVHPDQRRHGIGMALLQHCLDYLDRRKIKCVKLDATPLGQPLYEKLGFVAEWNLARWEGLAAAQPNSLDTVVIRSLSEAELNAVDMVDTPIFGVSRRNVLVPLAAQSRICLHRGGGGLNGVGFVRPGSRANYLGPVVARDSEAGCNLIRRLVSETTGRVFWDIPDQNAEATKLASEMGFEQQRTLVRMYRGDNATPGRPADVFALAAPEIG